MVKNYQMGDRDLQIAIQERLHDGVTENNFRADPMERYEMRAELDMYLSREGIKILGDTVSSSILLFTSYFLAVNASENSASPSVFLIWSVPAVASFCMFLYGQYRTIYPAAVRDWYNLLKIRRKEFDVPISLKEWYKVLKLDAVQWLKEHRKKANT